MFWVQILAITGVSYGSSALASALSHGFSNKPKHLIKGFLNILHFL